MLALLALSLIMLPLQAGLRYAPIRLPGEAVGAPILTTSGIVVMTTDGKLLTYDSIMGRAGAVYELSSNSHIAPLAAGTVILTATDDGHIEAIDRDRLKRLWIYPREDFAAGGTARGRTTGQQAEAAGSGADAAADANSSLHVRGMASSGSGLLYVIDRTRVLAFDERSGTLRFNYELLEDGGAAAADGERVYVMDGSSLKAISANGDVRWTLDVGALYKTKPVVDQKSGRVYVASTKGAVMAIDSASGEVNWSYSVNGWPMATPLPLGERVVIGTNDGRLRALNAMNGSPEWTASLGAAVWGEMSLISQGSERLVVVTTQAPSVAAVDADSGEKRWSYQLADWASSPAISADSSQAAVAARDKTLVVISVSPICSISSPLSGQEIGPYPEVLGTAWAWGGAKRVVLTIAGASVELPIGADGAFNYSPDLSGLKDGAVDMQCLAESNDNRVEKDAGVRKSMPTLSAGAQKAVMTITAVDSAQAGADVRVFVRNADGFDLEQLSVDFAGQHIEDGKSPLELKAPRNEGAAVLTINRRGFEPASFTLTVVSDKTPLYALAVGAVLIVAFVVYVLFLHKKQKREKLEKGA